MTDKITIYVVLDQYGNILHVLENPSYIEYVKSQHAYQEDEEGDITDPLIWVELQITNIKELLSYCQPSHLMRNWEFTYQVNLEIPNEK